MKIPYEVLYDKEPYVGNLQLFGALTYVYVPPGTRAADIRPLLRNVVDKNPTRFYIRKEDAKEERVSKKKEFK